MEKQKGWYKYSKQIIRARLKLVKQLTTNLDQSKIADPGDYTEEGYSKKIDKDVL